MDSNNLLIIIGIILQAVAWIFYQRDYPKFWVSRPVWYFLYPKGVALTIVGVLITLAGILLNLKAQSL